MDGIGPLNVPVWTTISSKSFQAADGVRAPYIWCLTATPMHNSMLDLGAYLALVA